MRARIERARRGEHPTHPEIEANQPSTPTVNGNLDRLDTGELDDWETVGRLTETPMPGIVRAVIRGNLQFGFAAGHRCYVLTDSTGRLSRSWRMDGRPIGSNPAHGIGEGGGGWAVGLDRAETASRIILTTVAGDFLAQHARAALEGRKHWAVVSLLGSSETLSREALAIVAGMEIEVPDNAGESLLRQLGNSGCRIEIRNESATPARP